MHVLHNYLECKYKCFHLRDIKKIKVLGFWFFVFLMDLCHIVRVNSPEEKKLWEKMIKQSKLFYFYCITFKGTILKLEESSSLYNIFNVGKYYCGAIQTTFLPFPCGKH